MKVRHEGITPKAMLEKCLEQFRVDAERIFKEEVRAKYSNTGHLADDTIAIRDSTGGYIAQPTDRLTVDQTRKRCLDAVWAGWWQRLMGGVR